MSQDDTASNFLEALEEHIDARVNKATLQIARLHPREREVAEAKAEQDCVSSKSALKLAIDKVLVHSRRPGV